MKRVTIIIPHYNSSKKLDRLLKSIFYQNYMENVEVIVIDDDSSDEEKKLLLNIVKVYQSHFKLHYFENLSGKKGAGVCRNIGIANSTTEWLLFADADDYFLEDSLKSIDKYIDKEFEVIFFKPTSMYESTQELSDRHTIYSELVDSVIKKDTYSNRLKLKAHFLVPWSKLISSKFIKEHNILFEEVMYSNDIMFSSQIAAKLKKFTVSSECVYCVTSDKNSLTTTMSKEILLSRLEVSLRQDRFYKENFSKRDYKLIQFQFISWLRKAIKYNFGFNYTLSILNKILKNGSKIIIFDRIKKKRTKKKHDSLIDIKIE
ncbi:glycosyltransferase family A protein [Enterococcus sp. AZ192]|uniref:glycosyltransferase family A protein n=1 Tax=unclassified Enterococcus TaxID=2608891 RepID=UPI003D2B88B0